MVTKTEVRNYYAEKHDLRDLDIESKMCPHFVSEWLASQEEDDTGIYSLASELFAGMPRDYLTMDNVKDSIRASIKQLIKDLEKISEY